MEKYLGVKLVEAEPEQRVGIITPQEGYKVLYADGYESWSPKEVFEKAYLKVADDPKADIGCGITEEMVAKFIKKIGIGKVGDKTTVVQAILVNGFEITETAACVDPAKYDEALGRNICIRKIKDKVWFLLGFLLQTGAYGIKQED